MSILNKYKRSLNPIIYIAQWLLDPKKNHVDCGSPGYFDRSMVNGH
jgi:hypothetical protein